MVRSASILCVRCFFRVQSPPCFTPLAPTKIFTCQELPPPPPPAARLCALSPLSGRFQKTVFWCSAPDTLCQPLVRRELSLFLHRFLCSQKLPLSFMGFNESLATSKDLWVFSAHLYFWPEFASPFNVFQRAWSSFKCLRARFPPGCLLLDYFLHPLFSSLCSKETELLVLKLSLFDIPFPCNVSNFTKFLCVLQEFLFELSNQDDSFITCIFLCSSPL